jgi:hypothetical protein
MLVCFDSLPPEQNAHHRYSRSSFNQPQMKLNSLVILKRDECIDGATKLPNVWIVARKKKSEITVNAAKIYIKPDRLITDLTNRLPILAVTFARSMRMQPANSKHLNTSVASVCKTILRRYKQRKVMFESYTRSIVFTET